MVIETEGVPTVASADGRGTDRSEPAPIVIRPDKWARDGAAQVRRRRRLEVFLAWLTPAVAIALWQTAASVGSIDTRYFPEPSTIATDGWELLKDGTILRDVWITARRVVLGFAIGVFAGIVVGVAMGAVGLLRAALEPTLSALYTVPKLAVFPLLLLIFGLGEMPKILLIAITLFFFVWVASMEAIAGVDPEYCEAARSFGSSRWQVFRHVLLPAALPQIFVGLRIAASVSILVIVAAEFVQGDDGIGYFIWNSWGLFLASRMYIGMAVVAIFGLLFSNLVRAVGRALTPWAPTSRDRTTAF